MNIELRENIDNMIRSTAFLTAKEMGSRNVIVLNADETVEVIADYIETNYTSKTPKSEKIEDIKRNALIEFSNWCIENDYRSALNKITNYLEEKGIK